MNKYACETCPVDLKSKCEDRLTKILDETQQAAAVYLAVNGDGALLNQLANITSVVPSDVIDFGTGEKYAALREYNLANGCDLEEDAFGFKIMQFALGQMGVNLLAQKGQLAIEDMLTKMSVAEPAPKISPVEAERQKYIQANNLDPDNLSFVEKMELKTHLRSIFGDKL